ncbi:MAG: TerC family protein [Deltaproteobacteria bacterium]|nr:MAG: TerC family protein [Deltaproteobacteria bacterium]
MLEQLTRPDAWMALATLTAMEIVLGIDNIVFIAILAGRHPPARRAVAYRLGLLAALASRIGLLFAISWVMGLTRTLFRIAGHDLSGRHLILLAGGVFLVGKAVHEIHETLDIPDAEELRAPARPPTSLALTVLQIMVLDIVFSLDSVITAVGMAEHLWVMVTAMVIAVGIMMVFAQRIGDFIDSHPSMKLLALSFLLLIGVVLVAEGWGEHIDRGYIYAAMSFALAVELMNMRMRRAEEARRRGDRSG